MKRTFLLIVLLLLCTVGAHASLNDQYLVIVGASAPASDVVIAANFVASMKGSVAVTFSSALDQDAYEKLRDEDLVYKTVVVINGKTRTVKILGKGMVADTAEQYFDDQGFATITVETPVRADLLAATPKPVVKPEVEASAVNAPQKNTSPPNIPKPIIAEKPIVAEPEQEDAVLVIDKPEQEAPPAPAPPENPGAMSRLWRWFIDLF